jgi:hypothetical protein
MGRSSDIVTASMVRRVGHQARRAALKMLWRAADAESRRRRVYGLLVLPWRALGRLRRTLRAPTGLVSGPLMTSSGRKRYVAVAVVLWQTTIGGFSVGGPTWTLQETPEPPGAVSATLAAVSCTKSTWCVAVGDEWDNAGLESPVGLLWDGTRWIAETVPTLPGSTNSAFHGLACAGPRMCVAVGVAEDLSGGRAAFAETRRPLGWGLEGVVPPEGTTDSSLAAAACIDSRFCVAVGWAARLGEPSRSLVALWDGSRWSLKRLRGRPGDAEQLTAVACSSRLSCLAMGDSTRIGGVRKPFAESWDGVGWKRGDPRVPRDGYEVKLSGVSCPDSTQCVAVGSFVGRTDLERPLVERWVQGKWSIVKVPTLPDSQSGLFSVTCSGAQLCKAAGYRTGLLEGWAGLVMSWNGVLWNVENTPNPPKANSSSLGAISCPLRETCIAAGWWTSDEDCLTRFLVEAKGL